VKSARDRTSRQTHTARVAQLNGTALVVGLNLQHSDTIVQLRGDVLVLIRRKVIETNGVRIMRADKSNVSKAAIAEVGAAVACGGSMDRKEQGEGCCKDSGGLCERREHGGLRWILKQE